MGCPSCFIKHNQNPFDLLFILSSIFYLLYNCISFRVIFYELKNSRHILNCIQGNGTHQILAWLLLEKHALVTLMYIRTMLSISINIIYLYIESTYLLTVVHVEKSSFAPLPSSVQIRVPPPSLIANSGYRENNFI